MSEEKERIRINSRSAGLRKRQGEAGKASKRSNKPDNLPQRDISDLNVEDFLKEAKRNNLDLAAIAAAAAEKQNKS
jgi:hypothetical protein